MYTNVILTNKRRTQARSNYTNTKLKAWFRRLLLHTASNGVGLLYTPGPKCRQPKRSRGSDIEVLGSKSVHAGDVFGGAAREQDPECD